ncbi:MAG: hypothetical protein L6Q78_14250 [Bacteroidia bacterium]|nr:hypothetical protein [Bacteroidia bacterium]
MKPTKISLLLFSVMLLASCTHRILDFTLISSKNVDFSKASTFVRGKQRVEGIDKVHWIIIIPTGNVTVKEALDKAIESTPGCVALLDGVVYSNLWWIPYIYGQESITVEGLPLIDPSLVRENQEMPAYGKLELNKKGEIVSKVEISQAEFERMKEKIAGAAVKPEFSQSPQIYPGYSAGLQN